MKAPAIDALPSRDQLPATLELVPHGFGHLLNRGDRMSLADFASEIGRQYDTSDEGDPRTRAVYETCRRYGYGRIQKDARNGMIRLVLPDMSRRPDVAFTLVMLWKAGVRRGAFPWGDTVGPDGSYGREKLHYLEDMGYLQVTGERASSGLGGSWPVIEMTDAGWALAEMVHTTLLGTPPRALPPRAALILADQLPMITNASGYKPIRERLLAFCHGTEPLEDPTADAQWLVDQMEGRMWAFGQSRDDGGAIRDWEDARALQRFVDQEWAARCAPEEEVPSRMKG